MTEPAYEIYPARYAKGQMVIRPLDSSDGYKGRASYLCDALNMKWVNRSRGYHASPTKVRRFERLFRDGWSATCLGQLVEPRQ